MCNACATFNEPAAKKKRVDSKENKTKFSQENHLCTNETRNFGFEYNSLSLFRINVFSVFSNAYRNVKFYILSQMKT